MRQFVLAAAVAATLCSSASALAEGALAVGRVTFDDGGFSDNYGVARNYETVGRARAVALADCRKDADVAQACRVVATFRRQCVSVAYAPEDVYGMGWGLGKDRSAAERQAVARCRADAEEPAGCRVDYTACDRD